tara:strand:- start:686 stop:973 length:288 start_codon:yes stop_codon:yes gene_type:complete
VSKVVNQVRSRGDKHYRKNAINKVLQTISYDEWFYAHELVDDCSKLIPSTGNITSRSISQYFRLLVDKRVLQRKYDTKLKKYQYRRLIYGSDSDK